MGHLETQKLLGNTENNQVKQFPVQEKIFLDVHLTGLIPRLHKELNKLNIKKKIME